MTDVATATQPNPEGCCVSKPTKSRFWLGFLLGLPVYPLVIPWIILSIPREWAEAYVQVYAEYIRIVMHTLGV